MGQDNLTEQIRQAWSQASPEERQRAMEMFREAEMAFPKKAIVGSLGDLARELARGTEVPEEFLYLAALVFLGGFVSKELRLNLGVASAPRLYVVLVGETGKVKKSSAITSIEQFFGGLTHSGKPEIATGVGSAEGLAEIANSNSRVVLIFDEFRTFLQKAGIKNSTLLDAVSTLFERDSYSNATKGNRIQVKGLHLSLLAACTTDTWQAIWTSEAVAIGLPNRILIGTARSKSKVAVPRQPDQMALAQIQARIEGQLARLPLTFDMTQEAAQRWDGWYRNLPDDAFSKRLDNIGFRFMSLIALTTDKTEVDLETIETVILILDRQRKVREAYWPSDAENVYARTEDKIRQQLKSRGALTKRELRQHTNADRVGIKIFDSALKNLVTAGEIEEFRSGQTSRFRLRQGP